MKNLIGKNVVIWRKVFDPKTAMDTDYRYFGRLVSVDERMLTFEDFMSITAKSKQILLRSINLDDVNEVIEMRPKDYLESASLLEREAMKKKFYEADDILY